jgi:hypothetical protein
MRIVSLVRIRHQFRRDSDVADCLQGVRRAESTKTLLALCSLGIGGCAAGPGGAPSTKTQTSLVIATSLSAPRVVTRAVEPVEQCREFVERALEMKDAAAKLSALEGRLLRLGEDVRFSILTGATDSTAFDDEISEVQRQWGALAEARSKAADITVPAPEAQCE